MDIYLMTCSDEDLQKKLDVLILVAECVKGKKDLLLNDKGQAYAVIDTENQQVTPIDFNM